MRSIICLVAVIILLEQRLDGIRYQNGSHLDEKYVPKKEKTEYSVLSFRIIRLSILVSEHLFAG